MKLNKVISLALGGVMALSMLAGCSSSSSTSTSTVTAATTNTGVVEYVESKIDSTTYNINVNQQAQVPFTGNESTDKTKIMNDIANGFTAYDDAKDFEDYATLPTDSGESEIYYVEKGDDEDEDLAKAILNLLADKTDGEYCVDTISVFDVVVDSTYVDVTVDGSAVDLSTEYWAIRVVNCKKQASGVVIA